MNTRAKRRLMIVTLVIIIVMIVVLALVGGSGAAKTLTVDQAASGSYNGKRVQVSGMVIDNSYATTERGMDFDMSPEEGGDGVLHVSYEGAVPSTFGNGVIAIATGTLQDDGTLLAGELLTKCPSKYESASGSMSVRELYDCGNAIIGTEVSVYGTVEAGSLQPVGSDIRFSLTSDGDSLGVSFEDALPDTIGDGSKLVITGALSEDGIFVATEVAEDESEAPANDIRG